MIKPLFRMWVVCASLALGCGATAEPPKPVTATAKAKPKPRPKVKRSLSAEQVQSKMREQVASMAACYELSPSKADEVAGELTVEFTVEASGAVSGESLAGSNDDKILGDCVLEVVRKTAFPKAETSIDVSWPLRFGAR